MSRVLVAALMTILTVAVARTAAQPCARWPQRALVAGACPADPAAVTLWTTGESGAKLLKINLATGATAVVGATGIAGTAPLAFHPNGTIYSFTQVMTSDASVPEQLAVIDRRTGRATPIGRPLPERTRIMPLIFAPDGTLYAAGLQGSLGNKLLAIDPRTGQPREIGPFKTATAMMDFTYDDAGNLFGATQTALFRIDTATGEAMKVVDFSGDAIVAGSGRVMGIHFGVDQRLYATDFVAVSLGNSSVYVINTLTGVATRLVNTGIAQIHSADMLPPPARERVATVIAEISDGAARYGLPGSLAARLQDTIDLIDQGSPMPVCNALYLLKRELAEAAAGRLTVEQTRQLALDATWAETSLDCPR